MIFETDAAFYFRHWTVVRVRLFSDIVHAMTKWIGKSGRKLKRACTLSVGA